MYAFTMNLAEALPSFLIVWGISYLLMIKRKRVKPRTFVILAYFFGPLAILSIGITFFSRGMMVAGHGIDLFLGEVILSVISCHVMRAEEKKYKEATEKLAQNGKGNHEEI